MNFIIKKFLRVYTGYLLLIPGFFIACQTDHASFQLSSERLSLPIVFVHGTLASGDTYATQFQRFSSNNYEEGLMFTYDWNTLNMANSVGLLDNFVNSVLLKTGKSKVILVGHSAGGTLIYNYCNDALRADKVDKYIQLGSNKQSKPAGNNGQIPTLNIWSTDDQVVSGDSILGAVNVKLNALDHYQIATHSLVFIEMYKFITGDLPQSNEIIPLNNCTLGGRVVSLGENSLVSGATVQIYEVDPTTGYRINSVPDTTLVPDANGWWGPVDAKKSAYYEFELSKSGDPNFRVVHYYREPVLRNNPWIYLRAFPPAGSTIGFLLNNLPKDDMQSVVAVFSSNQAIINGRDLLKIDGYTLSIPSLTAANQTTIALFLYDEGDCKTSLDSKLIFSFLPFLKGADVFFQTNTKATISLEFNGRNLNVPNWKSGSEGVIIPVFD
ncbi:MAG: hypothetical protein IPI30_17315 [Saprospiraceae bacterium]|nr:hypothetical protein [Candidatus Vicinibacter affinis]HQX44230.1 hypothetical protein [Saprospiraceae bacterium]